MLFNYACETTWVTLFCGEDLKLKKRLLLQENDACECYKFLNGPHDSKASLFSD